MKYLDYFNNAMALRNNIPDPSFQQRKAVAMAAIHGNGKLSVGERREIIKLMIGSGDIGPLNSVVTTEVQTRYKQHKPVFGNVMLRRPNVMDLREVAHINISGADERLKKVLELEEYGTIPMVQDPEKSYRVAKYGGVVPVSWESLVNDADGVMRKLPDLLLNGALKTLEGWMCSLYFGASGPSTDFFDQQPGGAPASTPLSITNLKAAVGEMLSYTGPDDDPVLVEPKYLVVPPALKITAMEILNSINMAFPVDTSGSGTGEPERMGTRNALADLNLQLLVSPWISKLVTDGTKGKTSWALFADPREIPAGELGFLEGFETPEITVPRIPSSSADENHAFMLADVLYYRVKSCFGGCTLDHRAGWASVGQ